MINSATRRLLLPSFLGIPSVPIVIGTSGKRGAVGIGFEILTVTLTKLSKSITNALTINPSLQTRGRAQDLTTFYAPRLQRGAVGIGFEILKNNNFNILKSITNAKPLNPSLQTRGRTKFEIPLCPSFETRGCWNRICNPEKYQFQYFKKALQMLKPLTPRCKRGVENKI